MTPAREADLRRNLEAVWARMARAREVAGRADDVVLVVVTKFFPASDVELLSGLGVRHVGENRDQEAAAKFADLPCRDRLTLHFIGQLQSNKAGHVARYADVVESVDRPKIARALDRAAAVEGRVLDVLVQVSLDEQEGRGGAPPEAVAGLADVVAECDALRLRGVMAVAPLGRPPRPAFARLRRTHEDLLASHPEATWRSAGMSGDLEEAIAEGATHLRVGTAILGSRPSLG